MFIPYIVNPNISSEEENAKKLLFNKGVIIMCDSVKGSEIKIKSKIVKGYEIDDFSLEDFIPQDKEIISIQFAPSKAIYEEVVEWLAIVIYRE